jgi:hypothetical protein
MLEPHINGIDCAAEAGQERRLDDYVHHQMIDKSFRDLNGEIFLSIKAMTHSIGADHADSVHVSRLRKLYTHQSSHHEYES